MSCTDFYEKLTPFYHLIYPDDDGNWDNMMKRQSTTLAKFAEEYLGKGIETILDVSCGIGTQALGLAQLGYNITASDLTAASIERAKREAEKREVTIDFSIADMREAFSHHGCQFDLVISCDNSILHLLTDEDMLTAFRQFYQCTLPGGGCAISVRDYTHVERNGIQVKPYNIRVENGIRYLVFQVWEFQDSIYDLTMYFVEDRGEKECTTYKMHSKVYAIEIPQIIALMERAGFVEIKRFENPPFFPIIIGKKT
jgi:SAM-dependent methyltransferase